MRFFVGLHQPSDAKHFDACFVSVGRLRGRKGPFAVFAARRDGTGANDWRNARTFCETIADTQPYQGHFIEVDAWQG